MVWNPELDLYVVDAFSSLPDREIARNLSLITGEVVTPTEVKRRRYALGLVGKRGDKRGFPSKKSPR